MKYCETISKRDRDLGNFGKPLKNTVRVYSIALSRIFAAVEHRRYHAHIASHRVVRHDHSFGACVALGIAASRELDTCILPMNEYMGEYGYVRRPDK